ncbi:MAG: R3H domain-containing nucleic acid-binding protein [Verrucomicrobiota bacterium]
MHISPKDTLELMLNHLGIQAEVEERDHAGGHALNILTANDGWLIADDHRVLDDVQYLLNRVILSEESDQPKIIVDVNGSRQRQHDEFMETVHSEVACVREDGEERTLPPMNSFERMLVHNYYKEDPEIETSSPSGPDRIKQITVRRTR